MEAGTARNLVTLGWKQPEIFLCPPAPHRAGNYETKSLGFFLSLICFAESLTQYAPSYVHVWKFACVKVCVRVHLCVHAHTCVCLSVEIRNLPPCCSSGAYSPIVLRSDFFLGPDAHQLG